jgi:predicted ATPase/class 3 adenylate cyclase
LNLPQVSGVSRTFRTAPDERPTGTVTFVFSDVEGSTQRWERYPAAMRAALQAHDEIVRSALVEHRGFVFKTIGDAFCAAFARPEDAAAAAIAVVVRLAAADFTAVDGLVVRMAVHTGTSEERDGDYFGPTVNRVARILSVAHGGQILVSAAASALLSNVLPARAALRDLGEHRLKDLARPEHVYQLLCPGLNSDFPPLRSLGVLPNNLPLERTVFVGRDEERAEIAALVRDHRLVTLTGSGGIGKTRTSLHVAADLLDGSGDGVWFVELAGITNATFLASTIAMTMNLSLASSEEPTRALIAELERKRVLLVLDNCEHLIEPVARLVGAILRACANVTILASSRQALGIAGEIVYRLPSLSIPTAISLFVDRARLHTRSFELNDANEPIVAEICRRLDGIPLAIELAAARVHVLGVRDLRRRLDERFRVLTGNARDVLPRQATLRALVDWSYDLLDDRERRLFERLGIFATGFMLEGAQAVSVPDLDAFDAIEVLGSLVDKSLVLAEPRGDAQRYRLLESTRVYAREKLVASGELHHARLGQLRYLRDSFADARAAYERTSQRAALEDVMVRELENVRAALDSAGEVHATELAEELLAEVGICWQDVGLDGEGLQRLETVLSGADRKRPLVVARLAIALSLLAINTYRSALALESATVAVACAREADEPFTLAEALRSFAVGAIRMQRFEEADVALEEAEATPGVSGPMRRRILQVRAVCSTARGDFDAAARAFEELRGELHALGQVDRERVASFNLAEVEFRRGNVRRAFDLTLEHLPALRTHGDRSLFCEALASLSTYSLALDDVTRSLAFSREALVELAAREPDSALVALVLEGVALAFAIAGNARAAARLEGYVDATLARNGYERIFADAPTYDRLYAILQAKLLPGDLAEALSEGARLAPQDAIALAIETP